MPDIFISYAREDTDAARNLAQRASSVGYRVWWDRNLAPGDKYHSVIEEQIKAAKRVIVIWSRHSVASRWVVDEAELAAQQNKLIPICIDDSQPPLGMRSYHMYKVNNWDADFKKIMGVMTPQTQYYTAIHVVQEAGPDNAPIKDLLKVLHPDSLNATLKDLKQKGYDGWQTVGRKSSSRGLSAFFEKIVPSSQGGTSRARGRNNSQTPSASTHRTQPGGSGRSAELAPRALSGVVDFILSVLLQTVVVSLFSDASPDGNFVMLLLVWLIYHSLFMSLISKGRTPGYLLTQLRVVDRKTSRPPGFGRVFIFALVRMFPLSWVWYFANSGRRMLHDIASGTDVRHN